MRPVTLNALRAGIERLRAKGGAKPDALYDLLNGYVTIDGQVRSRPGTTGVVSIPAGSKGLCAFNGEFVVFSHQALTIPASTPTVRCEQLIHPTAPATAIAKIHFAAPFMNALYVVAEFTDGLVKHYWLRKTASWVGSTQYAMGTLVQPTVPNGCLYRARRLTAPAPAWAPGVQRSVGDKIEPKTFNGYLYTVISTIGTGAHSGDTEPTWPATDGAVVFEDAGVTLPEINNTTATPDPEPSTLDTTTATRYDNSAGTRYNRTGVRNQAL